MNWHISMQGVPIWVLLSNCFSLIAWWPVLVLVASFFPAWRSFAGKVQLVLLVYPMLFAVSFLMFELKRRGTEDVTRVLETAACLLALMLIVGFRKYRTIWGSAVINLIVAPAIILGYMMRQDLRAGGLVVPGWTTTIYPWWIIIAMTVLVLLAAGGIAALWQRRQNIRAARHLN